MPGPSRVNKHFRASVPANSTSPRLRLPAQAGHGAGGPEHACGIVGWWDTSGLNFARPFPLCDVLAQPVREGTDP